MRSARRMWVVRVCISLVDMGVREVFPDELEHEELIEVGIEERAHDGVELPVVVMRAFGEVDVHGEY